MIESKCLWCHFQKTLRITNKWTTIRLSSSGLYFWEPYWVCSGLWVIQFILLQHKCFCYNPSPLETSRQRGRTPKWDVDQPSYFAKAFTVLLSVENQGLQNCSGWRAKEDWGCNRRRTLNLTKSLLEMNAEDNDLLLICADSEGVRGLLWSCLTFVSCVIENSLKVLVQANRSCCIAPWIQLRVRGAQMAVFFSVCFLCCVACCWVWCGLQRGEIKRTNTFLLRIPLWSEHFKQLIQLLCHWLTLCWVKTLLTCTCALVDLLPPLPSASCTLSSLLLTNFPLSCTPFTVFFLSWKFALLLRFLSLSFPNEQCLANLCYLPTIASNITAAPHWPHYNRFTSTPASFILDQTWSHYLST